MEAVDWGNLEALPLSLIFDELVERIDHIYFSVVSQSLVIKITKSKTMYYLC